MIDYADINGLKEIRHDLEKIKKNKTDNVKYIKEDELEGVLNLLQAIINTKEFNQRFKQAQQYKLSKDKALKA